MHRRAWPPAGEPPSSRRSCDWGRRIGGQSLRMATAIRQPSGEAHLAVRDIHIPVRPPRPGRQPHRRLRRRQQAGRAVAKQAASPGAGAPARGVHADKLGQQLQEVVAPDVGVGGTDLRGGTPFRRGVSDGGRRVPCLKQTIVRPTRLGVALRHSGQPAAGESRPQGVCSPRQQASRDSLLATQVAASALTRRVRRCWS